MLVALLDGVALFCAAAGVGLLSTAAATVVPIAESPVVAVVVLADNLPCWRRMERVAYV